MPAVLPFTSCPSLNSWLRTGINVDIFTRRFDTSTPDVVELSPGINVITLTAGPPEKLPKDDLYCLLPDFASEMAMYALESGHRYDIIHTHYWLSGWVGRILKRYWDVPVIHMYHTLAHMKNDATPDNPIESPLRLRVERELIGAVDQIVAPNPDERADLVWTMGAKDCQVCTLPPGIDLEKFQPTNASNARARFGLPDAPLVLFVGRIDPIKDVDTLLAAMADLIARLVRNQRNPISRSSAANSMPTAEPIGPSCERRREIRTSGHRRSDDLSWLSPAV